MPSTIDELLIFGVCLSLVASGWLARRGRRLGLATIQMLEPMLIGLSVVRAGLQIWGYVQQMYGSYTFMIGAQLGMGLLLEVFPPALFWFFFRRPEVRASFAGG